MKRRGRRGKKGETQEKSGGDGWRREAVKMEVRENNGVNNLCACF